MPRSALVFRAFALSLASLTSLALVACDVPDDDPADEEAAFRDANRAPGTDGGASGGAGASGGGKSGSAGMAGFPPASGNGGASSKGGASGATGGKGGASTGGTSSGGSTSAGAGGTSSAGAGGTSTGGTSAGGKGGASGASGKAGAAGTSAGGTSSGGTSSGGAAGAGPVPAGFLGTAGASVVDAKGKKVRLTGVSWFGMETSNFAPHGLWSRGMGEMLDQVKSFGFNSLRVPFCSQMLDAGSMPNGIDYSKNPSLSGKTPLEVLDALVDEAKKRGLRIVLDRHRPDANAQSELWYTAAYPEKRWIDDWRMLAKRYAKNPTVVGADLHNEPHGAATWGGDASTDWASAAERAGNAVLQENPGWLVIVEGVETAKGKSYWWGGNLRGAADRPIVLSLPGRLVYSIHDYPASVFAQSWFSDPSYPNNLASLWDDTWGYLPKKGTAPVWIGELGTKLQTDVDTKWLSALVTYAKNEGLGFAFWALNPNSGDTGGILKDDWMTPDMAKLNAIAPALAPPIE